MKIVYNPKYGAPITKYQYFGELLEPHYPDGYELDGKRMNGLKQYDDDLADTLIEHYTFLKHLEPNEAKKIVDRPDDPEFKCEEPGCEFKTTYKVALSGHTRKHNTEKAVFDEKIIPVAKTKAVVRSRNTEDEELKAGTDADGVDWYGPGLTTDSFSTVPSQGRGHFVG